MGYNVWINKVILNSGLTYNCTFRSLGGRLLAQRISVRTVTLIGGVVFLLFAVTSLFMDPNGE